ncbi:MAG: domain protein (2Fe-2S)-binding domain protein [Anaerosporomusa subterranea]|jgi:NAD(P)H-nitrite reductase large subunit|nr:domain protein (2Fe-2S)-binding domain protein [Anaerosporomusa subterranea]
MADDVLICRCEEVCERKIREAIADGATTLTGVKRRTSAGMGLCQGRTCRRLISAMLTQQAGIDPANLEPPTTRPPVRPVKVDTLLAAKEGGVKS